MIAKLERTQSNAQQTQNLTTNGKHTKQQINNNKNTDPEWTVAQATGEA